MHVHVLRITSCMSLHPVSRGVGDCRKSAEGPLNWSVLFVANITTIGKAEGQMMSSSSRSFRRSYFFSSLCSNSLTIFQPDNWVISGKNGTDVTLVDFGRSVDLSKAGGVTTDRSASPVMKPPKTWPVRPCATKSRGASRPTPMASLLRPSFSCTDLIWTLLRRRMGSGLPPRS